MFLRLFLAFLVFGALSGFVVGLATASVGAGVLSLLVTSLLGIGPAWFFAREFRRPLRGMQQSADRIAGGEHTERIYGGAWIESRELAHSLNEMGQHLVSQIERLTSERQQLRAILGGMAEGVVAIGPDERILFANAAAGRMLEFDPASALGRPLYEMTRQPGIQSVMDRAIRSRQPQREQMEFKKPASRHVSAFVAPFPDFSGAVLVLDDLSELRRLERLRQDFVANVSHELKTPLTVMQACVETLQDGAVEDPEIRGQFLQQIADGAERLHALILDLLSLARIESGEGIYDFDSLPVKELVEVSYERFRARAESKQLNLQVVPARESLTVWADAEAVGQILDNLLDNAVKYTPDGGGVRIRWSAAGKNVDLCVEDTGPGIPERDLSRIFERFYRVDKARARQLGGTGLGLSIVKHLIQAMNGSVNATSSLGRGSTFTISLPRTEE
jgi:two-component system, OmpR family, phosphate regulon sensor histidine kinase PhoR